MKKKTTKNPLKFQENQLNNIFSINNTVDKKDNLIKKENKFLSIKQELIFLVKELRKKSFCLVA